MLLCWLARTSNGIFCLCYHEVRAVNLKALQKAQENFRAFEKLSSHRNKSFLFAMNKTTWLTELKAFIEHEARWASKLNDLIAIAEKICVASASFSKANFHLAINIHLRIFVTKSLSFRRANLLFRMESC